MRARRSVTLCALLLGCQAAPRAPALPRPPAAGAPAAAPAAPPRPPPNDRTEEVAAIALRRQLLQLLPCDRGPGTLTLQVTLSEEGRPQAVAAGESTAPPEAARCARERVAAWRFPDLRPARREVALAITFPLTPPSLGEHAAVLTAGGGQVDTEAAGRELLRLRRGVLGCLRGREEPVLVRLRLGEWGRLREAALEAAPGAQGGSRERAAERACLRRVLRLGEFPNPAGGDVELRYPYVPST